MKSPPRGAVMAVTLGMLAGAAPAAVPEPGTREGDLACAGLTNLGLAGAARARPAGPPEVVSAMAMALGFYLGRLSKSDAPATKAEIDRAVARLSTQEKNTVANACLKRASDLMATPLR